MPSASDRCAERSPRIRSRPRRDAAQKRERLRGAPDLADVVYVQVDFEVDEVLDRLTLAGFDRTKPSVFVWEGVTPYLDEAAVDGVLSMVATCAPGTRLIFTYIHRGALDGTVPFDGAEKLKREVAALGEPWTFGFFPYELPRILASHGLCLLEDLGAHAYRDRYGAELGSERGYGFYRVAIAEVGVSAC